ncbi:Eukaryotic translation initiation factor 3 subunit [Klebsormidium nitens]|uniref:Eukaryotic translation initiation factor 3 subunit K n=1 Tax=Klebsormidium nitens TaxID=105231 RepID=A0A1Y1IL92_KLENI|nr:Eukaryotic translation initiation factor 3 subunit [Klebsormidium nitens]|eukprot:GAQ88878.1 Eukaryotic translation initiation factor 3 subunit [Klebsormidium nitens]
MASSTDHWGKRKQEAAERQSLKGRVHQILSHAQYNPDVLPDLEDYVQEQIVSETYDLNANLCLLRLYQFNPASVNIHAVARILVKGLMALPALDFQLYMSLIPERLHVEEPFATLLNLDALLETARFKEFWTEAARNRDILEVIPGFEAAMQRYAVHVLAMTYLRVPLPVLAEAINMNGPLLDKYIGQQERKGWEQLTTPEGKTVVKFPSSEYNTPSLRKITSDNLPLEQISKLLPVVESTSL